MISLSLVFYTPIWTQTTASVGVSISMPSIALCDIEPNNTGITLSMTAPTEAGNIVVSTATNNTKWLNFTSAVTATQTRRVTVQLSGTLPNGVRLRLATANYAGSGAGTLGSAASPIFITSTAQAIVNNIGGAYTGTGSGNGYNLTYSLDIQDYTQLRQRSNTLSIIYTLVDN